MGLMMRVSPLITIFTDCAFVNFVNRPLTERAAEALSAQNGIEIQGKRARVAWGRSKPGKGKEKAKEGEAGSSGTMQIEA